MMFIKRLTLLFYCSLFLVNLPASAMTEKPIIVGAEQVSRYLPKLKGKRVALVVNQTSKVFDEHLVDFLLKKHIDIKFIFAPEHGFRGNRDAGEKFASSLDSQTGIPLVSLYGKTRKPSLSIMKQFDVIVFDIQDVGVRFYTYISTMHYMMEAAADAGIEFIVLDRPNPNGSFIDGPVLEKEFRSFVGMHPIPILHGLTVAELAQMIKGEAWLTSKKHLALTVVKVKNYQRDFAYSLPVKPSPNLPNDQAIALYPSLTFFEATPVSIGRGTPFPFQVIGHDKVNLGSFTFTPVSTLGAATKPKLMQVKLQGEDLRHVASQGLNLHYLLAWYQAFAKKGLIFFNSPKFMDKLAGTDKLRKAIISGQSAQQIKQSWQADIDSFRVKRRPYLLYPDIN
ncbi:hypothetical protein CMT41_07900 [Colwellia sp. MT41]|nr:hypothetical protein CMT41_07900 [Colwellia sp. MT41]